MTKVDSVGSRGHRFRCARFDEGARVRPITSDTTVGALELWREAPAQHARTSHGSVFAPEGALACEERCDQDTCRGWATVAPNVLLLRAEIDMPHCQRSSTSESRTGRCAPAQPPGPRWSVDQAASR